MRLWKIIHPIMQTAIFLTISTTVFADDILYVAGTQPQQRPANAPVLTQVNKDASWYQSALHGVEQPYPPSLHFLENQGNWYNPFTHPGMLGHYDIRGWHTSTK